MNNSINKEKKAKMYKLYDYYRNKKSELHSNTNDYWNNHHKENKKYYKLIELESKAREKYNLIWKIYLNYCDGLSPKYKELEMFPKLKEII